MNHFLVVVLILLVPSGKTILNFRRIKFKKHWPNLVELDHRIRPVDDGGGETGSMYVQS